MTKAEIVKSISESTGVDKQASMAVVESFMEIVKESLAKDENVYLRGFGSFICKEKKPKQHAIYPRTQPLSFPHTKYRLSNRPRNLSRLFRNSNSTKTTTLRLQIRKGDSFFPYRTSHFKTPKSSV